VLNVNSIVIDPEVPPDIRRQLAAAPSRRLIRFGAQQPPAIPQPRRQRETVATPYAARAGKAAIATAAFVATTIAVWSSRVGAIGIVTLIASLASFFITISAIHDATRHGWRQRRPTADPDHPSWDGMHAVTTYHRHYVWPARDLDPDSQRAWTRAVDATNKIRESEAVKLIDSVEITTVLPYRLWEIAERLARLSTLRAEHQAILHGVEADDPDVAALLTPQRRAHELAVADVEQRLRHLEVFADLMGKADAARRRERAVRQLAALNDSHRDLLAQVGEDAAGVEMAEHASVDVQAIIDQADDAVRQANEAGRSLALPAGPPRPQALPGT
jgi:hypothetical protein